MNFSKLSNAMLSPNPIVELGSDQLSFIAGGCGNHRSHRHHHEHHHSHSSSSSSSGGATPPPPPPPPGGGMGGRG